MTDFIADLKKDITSSMSDVSPIWAELNAIVTLSTVLSNTVIVEKEKSLNLNLIGLAIGPPGIKKSLPMFSFTYQIIKKTGELVKRDFLLPSKSSVPGMITYASKKDESRVLLKNEGIIIQDEFSAVFKGARRQDWQSDALEFMSELYDGTPQKRVTQSNGLVEYHRIYANIISCTTYYFIMQMDTEFFSQGTGNRILYCHISADEYKVPDHDPIDYFCTTLEEEREKTIDSYANRLAQLYNSKLKNIYVVGDAGELWVDFKKKCEMEWKKKAMDDPLGWEYHPIKRYPEFALKLAGIYAVSNFIDSIPRMPEEHIRSFHINEDNMKKAIEFVKIIRKNFEKIVEIRKKYNTKHKKSSINDKAKGMLITLLTSKDKMLTTKEWLKKQKVSRNRTEFFELKERCLSNDWIEIISYKKASKELRKKFKMSPRSELCKYVKGF